MILNGLASWRLMSYELSRLQTRSGTTIGARGEPLLNILGTIPVGKLAYSAVLLALVIFLAREVYGIWFDSRLYVGKFEYFAEGKADADQTSAFPRHVIAQHHLLRSALLEEVARRQQERPAGLPAGAEVYHR